VAPRFQVLVIPPAARGDDEAEQAHAPGTTSWRLLGSNHRELGRSADVFDDTSACLLAIKQLRESISNVDCQVLAHSTAGFWFWRMQLNTVAIAISSRLYQRRRESVQSLTRTLESIPLVDREPAVLRIRPTPTRGGGRVLAGLARAPRVIDLREAPARSSKPSAPKADASN